ncbi:TetR/AcrR family transcriptional regulator [Maricurvus nonylphenolicus]|uniref:TetR/AcrR family transcriptional regulator n=1 Tax=Maricurvus nonylphenolicus TaxID=1008307 RepID=UPI0036F420E0
MNSRSRTPDKILEAARRLFNEKGYAATTLTEIAAAAGIAQGNLTYHFPTKLDLVLRLEEQAKTTTSERRAKLAPGTIADDYVEHLLFAMELTWNNRFMLRDRSQYLKDQSAIGSSTESVADYAELESLIQRIEQENMFRQDLGVSLKELTTSLWIVSRYWMDYLRETEGLSDIGWADQERGIQQHFAVLLPCLNATARKKFQAALAQASKQPFRPDTK